MTRRTYFEAMDDAREAWTNLLTVLAEETGMLRFLRWLDARLRR